MSSRDDKTQYEQASSGYEKRMLASDFDIPALSCSVEEGVVSANTLLQAENGMQFASGISEPVGKSWPEGEPCVGLRVSAFNPEGDLVCRAHHLYQPETALELADVIEAVAAGDVTEEKHRPNLLPVSTEAAVFGAENRVKYSAKRVRPEGQLSVYVSGPATEELSVIGGAIGLTVNLRAGVDTPKVASSIYVAESGVPGFVEVLRAAATGEAAQD